MFKNRMNPERGQIDWESEFGEALTEHATLSQNIVEIGAWHGEGSTVCLAKGMTRPEQRMWCLEQDPTRWLEASRFHTDPRIKFLNEVASEAVDQLPRRIDMILFDGGDDTTDLEFDLLYSRCRGFIALDDINERKNRRQFAVLKILRPLIRVNQSQRNGWAIFGV